ncbi:MAG: carboxypeptidase regulatory-like domain-containing protein [Acidobacteria bacterium]|nr:carboxypeptidase regulatory-like domain-containing protein [Acidobacteriota bacterium]
MNNMNAASITIFLAIFLFGSAQTTTAQTCATAPIGLVAAYSGENNALDARSRSNGTIQNNVTYAAGNVGQAFQLGGNGTNSNSGDRVIVGNPANLRLQSFTFEAWVKRSSTTILTNSPVAGFVNGTIFAFGASGWGVVIDQPTNRLALTQVGVNNIVSNLAITDTNWHHVAVSVSGAQVVFYLDGAADAPINYAATFAYTTNAAIGARGDADARNAFFGAIDELAIYNRVLAASEVQAIFNAGTTGKCRPFATVAPENQVLWLAGDGDAKDLSGSGNNGTLQAGAGYTTGKVGQGFQFNPGSVVTGGGFVTVADAPSLNPTAQLSVEGWVYPTTDTIFPNFMAIIVNKETNAAVQFEMARRLTTGNCPTGGGIPTGNFAIYVGGLSGLPDDCGGWVNGNAPLPLNAWSHVAMTYDGANLRAFVNGVNTRTVAATGTILTTNGIFQLGRRVMNTEIWGGQMDEMSVYNRGLTAAEIESIANAGLAGKYKVQSTVPTGLVAWYAGDGNANDISGNGNNGTLGSGGNAPTFAAQYVGQGFKFTADRQYAQILDSPSIRPTSLTIEGWANLTSSPTTAFTFFAKPLGNVNLDSYVIWYQNGTLHGAVCNASGCAQVDAPSFSQNVWHHVALTFDDPAGPSTNTLRLYVDGISVASGTTTGSIGYDTQGALVGADFDSFYSGNGIGYSWLGGIDEISLYNRALTATEIRDQFYAGSGGKYKDAINPAVSNTTKTGEATVTFGTITTTGAVHLTPLGSAGLPMLPMGTNTGLNFDVSTTAVYTDPTVCFNLPAFTPAQFANLRIFHLESGVWMNRTAGANSYPNLCTSGLTSLSPFAIAPVASTAANVAVGGRVTAGKSGLSRARVTLTDENGETRSVTTNSFGYYRFDDLEAGGTYTVSVRSKGYIFAPQVVTANDDLTELNFTAEP